MANILITAPSLDENVNISGISSFTKTLITNNSDKHTYYHFQLGKKDSEKKGFKWLCNQITLIPRFIYFLLKHKIDLVHLNTDLTAMSLIRDFPLWTSVFYLFRKKTLIHIHGGHFLMKPPAPGTMFHFIIKTLLKRSEVSVVLSEIEKKQIEATYQISCAVMPNAVSSENRNVHKDFSKKLSLFFMGRIVRSKGIFLLTDCLQDLGSWLSEFDLHIYGTGPDLNDFLNRLSAIEGLNYQYHGVVRGPGKLEALDKNHIFLLPSLFGEGLPIALLESMSRGCIPVVSDDASIGAVVTDGVNGYIIPKGSGFDLKDRLIRVFTDRDTLNSLSICAKNTIENSYNLENYLIELNKLYKTLEYGTNQLFRRRAKSYNV